MSKLTGIKATMLVTDELLDDLIRYGSSSYVTRVDEYGQIYKEKVNILYIQDTLRDRILKIDDPIKG